VSATGPVLLKKYGNRRLYDTTRSAFITLADVAELVKRDVEIRVVDAKTGEDLTRMIFLQIIMEHEKDRIDLLPIPFLRQLVTYRTDTLRLFFDRYLSGALSAFASSEHEMTKKFRDGFDTGMSGMMGMASPFSAFQPEEPPAPAPVPVKERPARPKVAPVREPSSLEALQKRLDELEKKLAASNKPARKKRS
jgi:polyhydroxyalkanoate synthesis repressor PhaR